MKKINYKIIGIAIALFVLIICYIVNRHYNNTRIIDLNRYISYRYDKNVCNVKVNGDFTNVSDVLLEAVNGFYTWEQLPLTENFKVKFSNRNNIVHIDNRVYKITNNLSIQTDESVIQLQLHRNANGIINELFFNTDTIYTYKYKIVGDKLDDIELIDKYDVNILTGEIAGTKRNENLV